MVDLHPDISMITLFVHSLNTTIKRQTVKLKKKKKKMTQLYVLYNKLTSNIMKWVSYK